jgi:hypothetical protein
LFEIAFIEEYGQGNTLYRAVIDESIEFVSYFVQSLGIGHVNDKDHSVGGVTHIFVPQMSDCLMTT